MSAATLANRMEVPPKIKNGIPYDPGHPTLGYVSGKKEWNQVFEKTSPPTLFIIALFTSPTKNKEILAFATT